MLDCGSRFTTSFSSKMTMFNLSFYTQGLTPAERLLPSQLLDCSQQLQLQISSTQKLTGIDET
jgi:hypothetical protein